MRRESLHDHYRSLARLALWAFGFLLVTSYLAVPCLVNDRAAFAGTDAASCHEAHVFRPNAPLPETFEISLPAEGLRFVLPALLLLASVAPPTVPAAVRRLLRRIRPWRSGTLPFATSDPPRLPAFAALRDA